MKKLRKDQRRIRVCLLVAPLGVVGSRILREERTREKEGASEGDERAPLVRATRSKEVTVEVEQGKRRRPASTTTSTNEEKENSFLPEETDRRRGASARATQ